MPDSPVLRVALLCGGLPLDSAHLRAAADDVDLVVHRSGWQPQQVAVGSEPPEGLVVEDHQPLWKSQRGHLAFLFPDLNQRLDRRRPDVVHVISEPWGLLALQAAEWVRRRPGTGLVLHGCDTRWHHGGRLEQAARRAVLKRTLPVTAGWAAENQKALDLARRNGLPDGSTTARIHTNPRDAGVFRPPTAEQRRRARAELGLRDEDVAVGFLGRLTPEKGVRLLLDSADLLHSRGFRFVVAGDGPLQEEVNQRRSPSVIPVGRLSHPEGVLRFFSGLDVLACPSLTSPSWEDQGPRAVLEAMLCGVVPVATPTGALPEMLDGHGVLAQGLDAAALADALVQGSALAADDDRRERLSEWAQERWSSTAVAAQLVTLWRHVAGQVDALVGEGRS